MPSCVVLIVDDESAYTDVMRQVLEDYGLEVRVARDAVQALRTLRDSRPDLILLDVMMPEVDGLTLLRMLRTDPDWPRIPVVVVSARATEADRQAALQAGADGFLAKPFTAQEMRAVLRRHLSLPRTDALRSR